MTNKQILIRSIITIAMPFVFLFAFHDQFAREIIRAFHSAWRRVHEEYDSYERFMNRTDY
jgi:hypothetical protein